MPLPGTEFFWDPALSFLERCYCRLLGIPIIGLRIRLRRLAKILPTSATIVLDAGCGRGVITRMLAQRYSGAVVEAIDENEFAQVTNTRLAEHMGLKNCHFLVADVTKYEIADRYDLIVSVDNLEHVTDDHAVLARFYSSMRIDGILVVHVPHFYRRWPLFHWTKNFDVPGHVRPGYHLPELLERVRRAGFMVSRAGFSFGFVENLINNISYAITGAKEQRKLVYAVLFPMLNAVAWLGQWATPGLGAGVWVIAQKKSVTHSSREIALAIDEEDAPQ
jgi:SAM-dependent methyltransferase